jgi:uncharacterized membrane protein
MTARVIAAVIGAFYLVTGIWAFVDPGGFAGSVATFSPYNRHMLHDAGAFSTGLGLVLIVSAWISEGLRVTLGGVLAASLLHLWAHIEDIGLGGHPTTDIPILALICVGLATALMLSVGRRRTGAAEAEK